MAIFTIKLKALPERAIQWSVWNGPSADTTTPPIASGTEGNPQDARQSAQDLCKYLGKPEVVYDYDTSA